VELASITDQTVVSRKTAIYSGLAALTALVLPGQVRAQAKTKSARQLMRWGLLGRVVTGHRHGS
jgi:hypothetical protein